MSHSNGTKAVVAAMSANIGIAVIKLIAWLLTGAASMLAESIHSVADSANQVLLLIGSKAAKKKPTELHPFGFGRDRYISAFLVAIILFSMGGLFACYEAFHKFEEVRAGHPNSLLESAWWWVPVVVLAGAIVAEGLSLRTAVHEARPLKGRQGWLSFIRASKSTELPVILLEDSAALTGLVFALIGVGMTLITGSGYWDVVGSGAIGLLLIAVAVLLAVETQSLLLGESASPQDLAAIQTALADTSGVDRVIHVKTIHIGPEDVLVAAKLSLSAASTADDVARVINDAEARVRAAVPIVGLIYLEPDIWNGSAADAGATVAD